MSFIAELKRRNVFRAPLAYVVAGWLLVEIMEVITQAFEAPTWVLKVFISVMVLGLVLVVLGLRLLCSVAGFRESARRRLVRLRAKWFADSARAAGYKPWTIKGAVQVFRKDVLEREAKGRTDFN